MKYYNIICSVFFFDVTKSIYVICSWCIIILSLKPIFRDCKRFRFYFVLLLTLKHTFQIQLFAYYTQLNENVSRPQNIYLYQFLVTVACLKLANPDLCNILLTFCPKTHFTSTFRAHN